MDPDPDPLVRGTDPSIRIRTKMSRNPFPNTVYTYIIKRLKTRVIKGNAVCVVWDETLYIYKSE